MFTTGKHLWLKRIKHLRFYAYMKNWKILPILSIKNAKKKIIMEENLRFSGLCGIQWFSDCLRICWIYDLFKPTTSIQHFIYIDFRIILTQFNINFSRQEHQIDSFLYVSFNASDSQVLSYTPFHFSLTVPLIRIKHVRF